MRSETPDRPAPGRSTTTNQETRLAVVALAAVVVLSAGWFVLSWRVAHNTVGDAIGEALGVALGLLIVCSVIGAVRGRGRFPDEDG